MLSTLSSLVPKIVKLKLPGMKKAKVEDFVADAKDGKHFWNSFKTNGGEYFGFIVVPIGGDDCSVVLTKGLSLISKRSSDANEHSSVYSETCVFTKNEKEAYCVLFDRSNYKLTVYYWNKDIPTDSDNEE